MTKFPFSLAVMMVLVTTACTIRETNPIIDAPKTATYHADLAACKRLAATKPQTKDGVEGGMIVGGLGGGFSNGVEGLIAGAIIGGMLGSYDDKREAARYRGQIVNRCMIGRGYRVIG